MGQPEDLMGAVTFLSSDASAYVTGLPPSPRPAPRISPGTLLMSHAGADLRVDGGYTVWSPLPLSPLLSSVQCTVLQYMNHHPSPDMSWNADATLSPDLWHHVSLLSFCGLREKEILIGYVIAHIRLPTPL
jgi:hypothetical protein